VCGTPSVAEGTRDGLVEQLRDGAVLVAVRHRKDCHLGPLGAEDVVHLHRERHGCVVPVVRRQQQPQLGRQQQRGRVVNEELLPRRHNLAIRGRTASAAANAHAVRVGGTAGDRATRLASAARASTPASGGGCRCGGGGGGRAGCARGGSLDRDAIVDVSEVVEDRRRGVIVAPLAVDNELVLVAAGSQIHHLEPLTARVALSPLHRHFLPLRKRAADICCLAPVRPSETHWHGACTRRWLVRIFGG